jgi:hypothetical protein
MRGWGGLTAVALIMLAITSRTETANERLRRIFATNGSSACVAQLKFDTQLLAAQVRALIVERDRLAGASRCKSIDDMTGAIKKQVAATAAALVAKTSPPTPAAPATAAAASSNPPTANGAPVATAAPIATATPAPKADTPGHASNPAATGSCCGCASERSCTAGFETKRIRPGPRRRRYGGSGPPTVGHREGQFRAAAERNASACRARTSPWQHWLSPRRWPPLPNSTAAACAHFSAARTACRAVSSTES